MLFWLREKSRFSTIIPKKSFITSTTEVKNYQNDDCFGQTSNVVCWLLLQICNPVNLFQTGPLLFKISDKTNLIGFKSRLPLSFSASVTPSSTNLFSFHPVMLLAYYWLWSLYACLIHYLFLIFLLTECVFQPVWTDLAKFHHYSKI